MSILGNLNSYVPTEKCCLKKEGKEWMHYGSPRESMNSARILSIIALPTSNAHLQARQLHRIIGTFSKVNRLKYRKLAQVGFRYAMNISTPAKMKSSTGMYFLFTRLDITDSAILHHESK
ncbi:hypothetical protein [Pectobacterium polaris]|uniref:hypothetical protein n=1 Tax=Pectobacterium polaris TaxID=2042057 RepID=UPI001581AE03|nr:hypothetical protein [Pectobacterium polaris]